MTLKKQFLEVLESNGYSITGIISIIYRGEKQIINKIVGNYEGVLIYNNNDKLPVMTQIYLNNGKCIPSTVLEVGPCKITQIKTNENDGYNAVQLGYCDLKKDEIIIK